MNYKELKQQAIEACLPRYDEKRGGIFIPALGIVLDITTLSQEATWDEGMALAKQAGKRLPTIDELRYIYCYRDAINAIIKEHGGTPLASYHWSSTESNTDYAWSVNFTSGNTYNGYKYVNYVVLAVADV